MAAIVAGPGSAGRDHHARGGPATRRAVAGPRVPGTCELRAGRSPPA